MFLHTSVRVAVPDDPARLAFQQFHLQVERAIDDIKHGANVSQLEDVYKISTRERIIKEVRLASPNFCGEDATWVGWDRWKYRR